MLIAVVALFANSALADEAEPKVKVVSAADLEQDVDLDEEIEVLSEQAKLENLHQKVGKMFTEKFGAAWNAARECELERSDVKWNDVDIWIDKKWL